jgi:phage/plasmid-like protein (TIGR03299 family)
MSHEISRRANGMYEMASTKREWHAGETNHQIILPDDDLQTIQRKAGMDWMIQRSKVRFATEMGQGFDGFGVMSDQHVLLRSDTKAPLSIVSDGYKVVQPAQVLEFFKELVEGAGFKLETAGTLFGGKKFWALAYIGDDCEIVPKDRIGGYLGLATSCDGSMQTTGQFTAVRWVCNNTLSMSLEAGGLHKISHKTTFNPEAMKSKLGIAHETFHRFSEQAVALSKVSVSNADAEDMTTTLLMADKVPTLEEEIEKVRESLAFKRIQALFEGAGKGSKLEGVQGTTWGWLNACTEYADHHVRATNEDNRMNSAWFGAGKELKARALEMALDHIS